MHFLAAHKHRNKHKLVHVTHNECIFSYKKMEDYGFRDKYLRKYTLQFVNMRYDFQIYPKMRIRSDHFRSNIGSFLSVST